MRAYTAFCTFSFSSSSRQHFFSSWLSLFFIPICPHLFLRCVLDTAAWDGLSEVCVSEERLHRPPRGSSDECYSSALVATIHHFLWPRHPQPGESSVGYRQHLGGGFRHQPIHSAWHLRWWWACLCRCDHSPSFNHLKNDLEINLTLPHLFSCLCLSPEGVSHEESWSFYPNAVRTAGFCGNPSFHLYWPNKNQDRTHNILATRELIVQPGYILQFKVPYCKRATSLLC